MFESSLAKSLTRGELIDKIAFVPTKMLWFLLSDTEESQMGPRSYVIS